MNTQVFSIKVCKQMVKLGKYFADFNFRGTRLTTKIGRCGNFPFYGIWFKFDLFSSAVTLKLRARSSNPTQDFIMLQSMQIWFQSAYLYMRYLAHKKQHHMNTDADGICTKTIYPPPLWWKYRLPSLAINQVIQHNINCMKMKKVNKQCLLDTPRTVRVSEKTWQVIVRTRRP